MAIATGTAILASTLAASAIGAGATMYGANKQAKANQAAQNQNAAQQDKQNRAAWGNWLMTRGLAPTTPVEAGVMPTAGNYKAVNTRMPLWATVNFSPTGGSGMRLVKKGTGTASTGRPGITGLVTSGG
jgi:hypothetical protein